MGFQEEVTIFYCHYSIFCTLLCDRVFVVLSLRATAFNTSIATYFRISVVAKLVKFGCRKPLRIFFVLFFTVSLSESQIASSYPSSFFFSICAI